MCIFYTRMKPVEPVNSITCVTPLFSLTQYLFINNLRSLYLITMPASEEAIALKRFGNKAFASHEWLNAIDYYNRAIEVYADDPSFYCNKAQVKAPESRTCSNFSLT